MIVLEFVNSTKTNSFFFPQSEYGERKLPTDRAAGAEAHKAVVELGKKQNYHLIKFQ